MVKLKFLPTKRNQGRDKFKIQVVKCPLRAAQKLDRAIPGSAPKTTAAAEPSPEIYPPKSILGIKGCGSTLPHKRQNPKETPIPAAGTEFLQRQNINYCQPCSAWDAPGAKAGDFGKQGAKGGGLPVSETIILSTVSTITASLLPRGLPRKLSCLYLFIFFLSLLPSRLSNESQTFELISKCQSFP